MESQSIESTYNKGLEIIDKLKLAIEFEAEHQYINAIGKTGDFSAFVRRQAQDSIKLFRNSDKWYSILNLIERYPHLDLASRMQVTKKIIDILIDLKDLYSREQKKLDRLEKSADDVMNLPLINLDNFGLYHQKIFDKLGISNIEELLNYLPRTHISYAEAIPIRKLVPDTDATILGHVLRVSAFQSPKKNLIIVSIIVKDRTGSIKINKFFQGDSANFYLKKFKSQIPEGSYVICLGRVKMDKYGRQKIFQDQIIELISEDFCEDDRKMHTAKILPVYPLTEGLSLRKLQRLIFSALENYGNHIKEFVPDFILQKYELVSYAKALKQIHFPESMEEKDQAARRLLFNQFFLMQIKFMQERYKHKKKHSGIKFNCFDHGLVDKFIASLNFELTHAQKRVFYNEILLDMVAAEPMHRLLQGDVGSGKTVVAFLALLLAVSDGYQAAIMVPTEILAEQHYRKFAEWIQRMGAELDLPIALLIGKQKTRDRKLVLESLRKGSTKIVVGTHALIQQGVEFNNLGLIIIDEQHRFGVKQRELLANKVFTQSSEEQLNLKSQGLSKSDLRVEKLFMTATPIPRTLALAIHGDLDMSEIDEMPLGRLPIITQVVQRKSEAHEIIKTELDKGNQAYIVFPLINESESLSAKAATVEYEKLKETSFKDYSIGLIHGKLKDEEKENIMQAFRNKQIQILVATTVIEVGVDVPDATVILIESAERFGLAQLHQLRGRVGRSDKQSYCLLSSYSKSQNNLIRLSVLCKNNNGFIVAQEDLKLRGSGDLAGLRQSGLPESVLEGLIDQEELLKMAREAAKELINIDPELELHDQIDQKLKTNYSNLNLNAG